MGSSISAIRDREDDERYRELHKKGEEVLRNTDPYQYMDKLNTLSQLIARMQDHYVGSIGGSILGQMEQIVNELRNNRK